MKCSRVEAVPHFHKRGFVDLLIEECTETNSMIACTTRDKFFLAVDSSDYCVPFCRLEVMLALRECLAVPNLS